MKFTRRSVLRASAAAIAAPALGALGVTLPGGSAAAQGKSWRHGLSLFGDLKYPDGFKNFD
jgi:microcin C transport system substrate-binding protein